MFQGFLEGLKALVWGPSIPQQERRATVRLRCAYEVVCYDSQGDGNGVLITEISPLGMRLEGRTGFPRGSQIEVAPPARAPHSEGVRCTVIWSRRRTTGTHRTGVVYADPQRNLRESWVQAVLDELGFEEEAVYQQRRHVRFASTLDGEVLGSDGSMIALVTVVNLGVGGALLRGEGEVPQDTMLRLVIEPHGGLRRLELTGVAIRRGEDPDVNDEKSYNFRFAQLDEEAVERLGTYLIYLLKEGSV